MLSSPRKSQKKALPTLTKSSMKFFRNTSFINWLLLLNLDQKWKTSTGSILYASMIPSSFPCSYARFIPCTQASYSKNANLICSKAWRWCILSKLFTETSKATILGGVQALRSGFSSILVSLRLLSKNLGKKLLPPIRELMNFLPNSCRICIILKNLATSTSITTISME